MNDKKEITALDFETSCLISYRERPLDDKLKTVIRISKSINPKNSNLEINNIEIYNIDLNLSILNLTTLSTRYKPTLKILIDTVNAFNINTDKFIEQDSKNMSVWKNVDFITEEQKK